MSAHTPGPWTMGDSDLHVSGVSVHGGSGYHTTLLRMVSTEHGMGLHEIMANAKLITAAPELLEALEHVVHWFDQLNVADIARYKAIIAKATS